MGILNYGGYSIDSMKRKSPLPVKAAILERWARNKAEKGMPREYWRMKPAKEKINLGCYNTASLIQIKQIDRKRSPRESTRSPLTSPFILKEKNTLETLRTSETGSSV